MQNISLTTSPSSQAMSMAECELALLLLGPSAAMAHLWSQLRRLAPHARTVLLAGPQHSGHEAAARLLLDFSFSPKRPMLVLQNAEAEERLTRVSFLTTLPQEAFLVLPQIDALSLAGQDCLLRLLRTRRNRNFSLVAATSEDLRALVSVGRFSPDLAEVLGSVRVRLPALKDRIEDLPMLLAQMLNIRCEALRKMPPPLPEDLLRAAMQHTWPGNLHELREVADALVREASEKGALHVDDLTHAIALFQAARSGATSTVRMMKLDAVVQEHIFGVLRGCRGNKLRAAEVLGISRSTLYRMLDAASQSASLSLAS